VADHVPAISLPIRTSEFSVRSSPLHCSADSDARASARTTHAFHVWLCRAVAVPCRAVPCRGCASRSCRMQCRKSGRARVRLRMPCRMPCDVACSVACSVACCVSYAMRRGQAVQYANQQKYRSARARTDHLQHGCPSARHRPQLWWWVDVAGKASPKCTLSKTAVRLAALYRPLYHAVPLSQPMRAVAFRKAHFPHRLRRVVIGTPSTPDRRKHAGAAALPTPRALASLTSLLGHVPHGAR
jgi:hypothetical protein